MNVLCNRGSKIRGKARGIDACRGGDGDCDVAAVVGGIKSEEKHGQDDREERY